MAEFALIERIRARAATRRADVLLGIGDDAAVLDPQPGMQLAVCTDTLNAGVHFPAGTAPDAIGWKALAVNLSDLAAMGAEPAWALLALSLPAADAALVDALGAGLLRLAETHGVALVGGDTTRGPLSLAVTALGQVPAGLALARGGARAGDAIVVTGTLGDAAAGLELALHAPHATDAHAQALRARLDYPQPRVRAGIALRGRASACIDISDGLLADLGHLCVASGTGAEVELEALPLSGALAALRPSGEARMLALGGGDDYELCASVPPRQVDTALAALHQCGCGGTVIGRIVAGSGVRVRDGRGNTVTPARRGYEHFA